MCVTHTHTHTHTYVYMYILLYVVSSQTYNIMHICIYINNCYTYFMGYKYLKKNIVIYKIAFTIKLNHLFIKWKVV